ncbi:MAG TPA: L-serine ammonia-lyase, iron-sulfur-dependent, subunit alpha, partial [Steroidobacteraceae bacterium]|nr:L-serine ammonia-lyase, iron-sulfur-dependent, subunit alpha [Steroidobacteraceae bacterium]
AGGRVVTAPTNGAAGVIPAVAHYYWKFMPDHSAEGIFRYFLTAAAIGVLYKENASISGAEVGCQGEVGVACSMAAAGLCAALGGTNAQIENAAEIGMEHHLGMTCDPVGGLVQIPCIERNAFGAVKAIAAASLALHGTNEQVENAAEIGMEHNLGLTCDPVAGLVQIPCIERNAMGAVKAINAARLAMRGDGTHKVSLDQVIATMRQTGADMSTIYKETSQGGLAVNVPEC